MKTATGLLKSLVPICVFALASASAAAQHAHGTSPYAHGQSAEIPSLTAEEVRELRTGEGMGLARAERHLADLFASGRPSAAEVARMTGHLGVMRGQLRAIHLLAHIEAARELTPGQIEGYQRLRGYAH